MLVKYTIILTDQYNLKLGNKQKKFQRGRWTVDIAVNYKFISIKFRWCEIQEKIMACEVSSSGLKEGL